MRKHVKLTLYEYRSPIRSRNEMLQVKSVETDSNGKFDFGPLKAGHYSLSLDDEKWGTADWFDVEITNGPPVTESVIIDVSPVFPDCKGGHELGVRSK